MDPETLRAYVVAASAAQGLALSAEELERVIVEFARVQAIAAPVLATVLPAEVEPAPVFRP